MLENYIQIFDFIFRGISLFAFLYIIYFKLKEHDHSKKIEDEFLKSIKKNQELSNEANNIHFQQMQKNGQYILDKFNSDFQIQLQKNSVNIEMLGDKLLELLQMQNLLNSDFNKLTESTIESNNEIKKRDAIIDRKNRQISKLKVKG